MSLRTYVTRASPSTTKERVQWINAIEQWRDGIPQGWLARDHPAWFRSTQRLKHLQRQTRGRVIPGHDKETFLQLQSEKSVFT
jgi:hypothetical protein